MRVNSSMHPCGDPQKDPEILAAHSPPSTATVARTSSSSAWTRSGASSPIPAGARLTDGAGASVQIRRLATAAAR